MSEKQKVYKGRVKTEQEIEQIKRWEIFIDQTVQKSPERIENSAKAIAGIISITLTLLVSLSDKNTLKYTPQYQWAIELWIGSLLFAFLVHFPMPEHYNKDSVQTFILTFRRLTKRKYYLLLISALLYLAGLICLCLAVKS